MRQFLQLFRCLIPLLAVIILSIPAFGQAYNFNQVSIKEGLPQSQAFAITFDSFERAWIGTQGGGLCIYDGSGFKYITKNDSLISNRIFVLKKMKRKFGLVSAAEFLFLQKMENGRAITGWILLRRLRMIFVLIMNRHCLLQTQDYMW
ncbi:MAG: hypothetical protein IPM77_10045 [Crocinitomicaceae bacterium]|nr:hypothetical protein [Crocinitomicaceae bacterium]